LRAGFLGSFLFLAGAGVASGDYESGQVVVILNPGHAIEDVNASWGTTTLDAFAEGDMYLLDATDLGDVEELAERMGQDPAIAEAEANYVEETPESIRQMVVVIVGGGYGDYEDQQIGARIGLDGAHLVTRGAGVTIGVIDSGVDPNHVALAGRLSPLGYDFVANDPDPSEEANGIDDDLDLTVDEGFGHGTMVAGIAALVAPEATILPVRVLTDEGHGDAYNIAKGIRYAVNRGATVLNLSFGTLSHLSIVGHQIAHARSVGTVIVAGAGNESLEQAYYPAEDSKAEMVTAVDSLDIKAVFADWEEKVLVSAPGTGVRSCYPGGEWAVGHGCSFATPFVSGEAALIQSLTPFDPPDSVRNRIRRGTISIDNLPENGPYREGLGSGRIYIPAALPISASAGDASAGALRIVAAPNPSQGMVSLRANDSLREHETRIYDAAGRMVAELARADAPVWDGRTDAASPAAAGIYFVRLERAGVSTVVRVTLLR
jgi:subtilisin family serine protease